jgi:3-oxoacyl-[acyl-carrier protein] reductase
MRKLKHRFLLTFAFICTIFYANIAYSKTYLVTCATSGIGQAIAKDLASQGDTLILVGRNLEKLSNLKNTLETNHKQKHHIVQCDFEDKESITKVINDIGQVKLDGIVLIRPRVKTPMHTFLNGAEWNNFINLTYSGPMELLYRAQQRLNTPSSIVIIGGITSSNYIPEYGNSSIVTSMWVAATKNLSYQLAKDEVRVNIISPFIILTDHNIKKIEDRAKQHKTTYEKQLQKEVKLLPSSRYGEPNDVSNLVKFLLSKESSYINGVNIPLDGGFSKGY